MFEICILLMSSIQKKLYHRRETDAEKIKINFYRCITFARKSTASGSCQVITLSAMDINILEIIAMSLIKLSQGSVPSTARPLKGSCCKKAPPIMSSPNLQRRRWKNYYYHCCAYLLKLLNKLIIVFIKQFSKNSKIQKFNYYDFSNKHFLKRKKLILQRKETFEIIIII